MTALDATRVLPPRLAEWQGTERYQVRRFIGAGSMGTVYEAFDRERGQPVALKRLRHFSPAALYLFKQEFRALVDVGHPNLVRLHELVATDPHDIFFAMELVRGTEFLEHVRARDGADTDRLRVSLRQLVEGVQALHAAGKLHRDIKPSNVLVSPEGRVVLLDFGVATEISRVIDPNLREDDAIVGTAAYMAPEQAAGNAPTAASDWYSVGAILYEVLAGRPPFVGSVAEVLKAKGSLDPAPPSRLVAGVPPDLDALCGALLQRQAPGRPSGEEILRWLGVGRRETTSVRALPDASHARRLVGRKAQLDALREALEASRRGAVTVQVAGLSGMGKSSLVQEFLDDVVMRGEGVVLRGRAYERESVPYKAIDGWVDALSRYLLRLSDQGTQIPLPEGVWALARLFPVLRRVPEIADTRDRMLGDPQRLRHLAFGALRDMLASVAGRQPLAVCVDDVHWGDADSAALLLDLVRPPDAPRLLLLMTHRQEEAGGVFVTHLRGLWPAGAELREVAVGPLDAGDARALALALLGSADASAQAMAEDVARESAGSPFLVEELVRSQQSLARPDGSATKTLTLEQSVLARLDALPIETRRIFEIVAVGGRPLPTATVGAAAAATGIEEDVELLRARRFVRVGLRNGQEVLEATHDRIAQAVVASLPPERVRDHHAELARVLEATSGSDPEAVALHLTGAGKPERASPYAERAAEAAIGKLAFDRAAQLFRLALDAEAPTSARATALRVRFAEALAWAGRGAQAARVYLEAAEGSRGIERLELERAAADQLLASGHIDEGGEALRRVLAAMGMRAPRSTLSALFWLLVYRAWLAVRGLRFTERGAHEVRHEDRVRIETMYAVALGFALVDVVLGACMQTRFLILALGAGDRHQILRAASIESNHRASRGGPEGRSERALLDLSRSIAAGIGDAEAKGLLDGAVGVNLFLRGRWREARATLDASSPTLVQGPTHRRASGRLFATSSSYFLGELKALAHRHDRLAADAANRGDLFMTVNLATTTTITRYLAADDPEGARRQLREALKQWSQSGFLLQQWQAMAFEPDIDLYEGDGAAAYDRLARDLPALKRSLLLHIQFSRCITLYTQGRCAAASIEPRPALRTTRIAEARRVALRLRRERMPWAETLAHTVGAAAENAAGDRAATLGALRAILASAEKTEMAMHACAARHRLGELLGGDEGRALVDLARQTLTAEGIRNHPAWLSVFLPGRWDGRSA